MLQAYLKISDQNYNIFYQLISTVKLSENFLNLKEYQDNAIRTAIYPSIYKVIYPALGLNGEAGEVADKIKRIMRDYHGDCPEELRIEIAKELGDVLWYVAALCTDLDLDMDQIARDNLIKLRNRMERDMIRGSGDNR